MHEWCISDILLRSTIWKEEDSNSPVHKPDKHYLSQVIEVSINSDKP